MTTAQLDRLRRVEGLLTAIVVSTVGGVVTSDMAPNAARQRARWGALEILRERQADKEPFETREGVR